jgi:hypothetical protein
MCLISADFSKKLGCRRSVRNLRHAPMKAKRDYLRRLAEKCRSQAERASPPIAKVLRAMADEYDAQARQLNPGKRETLASSEDSQTRRSMERGPPLRQTEGPFGSSPRVGG